jgi:hypothetical protein
MSLSVQMIEGQIVSKLIERNKKDVRITVLITDDGREILLRQDKECNIVIADYLNHKVKVSGIQEGSFFTPFEITDTE